MWLGFVNITMIGKSYSKRLHSELWWITNSTILPLANIADVSALFIAQSFDSQVLFDILSFNCDQFWLSVDRAIAILRALALWHDAYMLTNHNNASSLKPSNRFCFIVVCALCSSADAPFCKSPVKTKSQANIENVLSFAFVQRPQMAVFHLSAWFLKEKNLRWLQIYEK